ncbi:hypothetical protein GCT19_22215 [Paraburkholderia sp. CNPSo 3155]|uniref:hypothetical protein n=1 Tax=Paraburkholderia atlantica TaxID=2654982 RepID=UPI00128AF7A4|nr:hypothetical protein [Paraburkholderia atlantica]MPW08351.1 hypothetical protein [Paraburkholderia atlantica]
MEIVEIQVEYPSGMTISDRASYLREMEQVYPSERLLGILREVCVTEAPPAVSALIDGATVRLDARTDGSFGISETLRRSGAEGVVVRLLQPFTDPTKDQQQQFGRFCHTIAAAAFLGAVGVWHSTQEWTLESIKLEASIILGLMITFVRGMHSMKGE